MLMNWLRNNRVATVLLTVLRLYLGYTWITAGLHKLTGDKAFDAAGFIKGAIAKPIVETGTTEHVYPNFVAFLEHFALPNVKLFNYMIPWGEFLIGLGLLLGALTTVAMFFGVFMNFIFLYAGTVSTNPWMVMLGVIILAAGANAGKFGVDYYLMPMLRTLFTHHKHHKPKAPRANINKPAMAR